MGKDFKEKYDRICSIKDKAICLVETQLNGDISTVDAKELGEVADIAKDMAELMKLCSEAEYYHKVTEAMDESSEEEKSMYLNKYIPEYEGKFYTPMPMVRSRDSRGRYMYTEPHYPMDDYKEDYSGRMYYTSMNNRSMNEGRDAREGMSGLSRKMYMEHKNISDKETKMKEFKDYIGVLSNDIAEMVMGLDANDKAVIRQEMTNLASKIV